MNIKKPSQSTTIYVRDLNANDLFVVPGQTTVYVCDSRQTGGGMTRVDYHVKGDVSSANRFMFAKVNLSTIYLLDN